jgi:hypothetical protein
MSQFRPGNTRSSSSVNQSRSDSLASRSATSDANGTERTLPDFGVVTAPPAKLARTRSADTAKSTSRQRGAMSSPRRRPVNAAVR